ncbi:MAG: hypothetical protein GY820_42805 [Gammaproteobacteria bacterium]|nr:hypothetical protein [Gammaproteobacteria bacterium]
MTDRIPFIDYTVSQFRQSLRSLPLDFYTVPYTEILSRVGENRRKMTVISPILLKLGEKV